MPPSLAFLALLALLEPTGAFRPHRRPTALFATSPKVTYDDSFSLTEHQWAQLDAYLSHPDMVHKVCEEANCREAVFMGALFQPLPFSLETPHGMPKSVEPLFHSADHVIINVPALLLFKSKIFAPQRMCAVYKVRDRVVPEKDVASVQNVKVEEDVEYLEQETDPSDLWLPDIDDEDDDFDYASRMI